VSMFDGFKFRSVSSPVHKMDPRAKFFYVCVLFSVAVMFNQMIPLLILFIIQIPFVLVANVEKEWIRSMRGSALFAVLIFAMNFLSLYFYGGYTSLASILERSLAMTLRFIVLIEVRFVPVLAEEAQTIMDAQKARGLELEGGNFIKRIRNYIPILIPLIVNAIRRSLELAETMESRAWGANKNRTNLYVLKVGRNDYYLILISLFILAISIYVSFFVQIPSLNQILLT